MWARTRLAAACDLADRSILFVFQMVSADHGRDSRFVLENGLVDPGVVTLVTDHDTGTLRPDQEAVGLDLQIAVDQVAVRADRGVRTFGQADGCAGVHPPELDDRLLLIGAARP